MSTERNIALNALTLLVRKNDPTVFDNPDIFEKHLIDNGTIANSEEIAALKLSLKNRIPWEIRRGGTVVESAYAANVVGSFATKANISVELADWVVKAWMAALGLRIKASQTTAENIQKPVVPDSSAKIESNQAEAPKQVINTTPQAFSKPQGRIGVIFGEDNNGSVKVFNAWYDNAAKSECSGLAATPVKLKTEPVVLFKAASKKAGESNRKTTEQPDKTEKQNNNIDETVAKKNEPVNNQNTENTISAQQTVNKGSSTSVNNEDTVTDYAVNPIEKKAMELLEKGSHFTIDAIKMLAPVAVSGSAFSCRLIGELYYRGHGVKQDFRAAKAWLEKAADMDDTESQYLMGNIYQFGMGAEQNIELAKQFFTKAAQKNHKKALESLNLINGLVGI